MDFTQINDFLLAVADFKIGVCDGYVARAGFLTYAAACEAAIAAQSMSDTIAFSVYRAEGKHGWLFIVD